MNNKQLLNGDKPNLMSREELVKLLEVAKSNSEDMLILAMRLSNGVSIGELCSLLIEHYPKINDGYQKSKKASKKLPKEQVNTPIDEATISEFRDSVKNCPKERAIFELFLCSGIRPGEVAALRNDDVNLINKHVIIKSRKHTGVRTVPISDECACAIKEYLEYRCIDSNYLFVTKEGVPVTEDQINIIIRRKSPRVNFKRVVTPRKLRMTFIFNLVTKKVPPHLIGEYLGVNPNFLPQLLKGMIYH